MAAATAKKRRMHSGDPRTKATGQVSDALTKSARSLEKSADALGEETDRRVSLAEDRTFLAAERTYAAWVRTGLAALAAGIGTRAVLKDAMPLWLVQITASVLILFAAFCLCAAIWREFYSVPPGQTRLSVIPRALLFPLNGFLVLVTLAALVGVWLR
jgi:inner membrane protein YidH